MKNLIAKYMDPSNEVERGNRDVFNKKIRSVLGDSIELTPAATDPKSL